VALGGRRFDDDLVEPGVDVPVDRAQVVAGGVAPVVDEFEPAGALRAGAAAAEAGDDRVDAGDAQRFELAQCGGVDQRRAGGGRNGRRRGYDASRGSASIAPRTISSGEIA
jgi:hypothetical protein